MIRIHHLDDDEVLAIVITRVAAGAGYRVQIQARTVASEPPDVDWTSYVDGLVHAFRTAADELKQILPQVESTSERLDSEIKRMRDLNTIIGGAERKGLL